jgi:hypothetical protein
MITFYISYILSMVFRTIFLFTLLLLLILVFILYSYSSPRYIRYLPTFPFLYPNSKKEAFDVAIFQKQHLEDLKPFFKLTDKSVAFAFEGVIPGKTLEELEHEIIHWSILTPIVFFKYSINRPRPWQVYREITPLSSVTDKTPSYPAGHAYQAYYLAKKYAKEYPELKEKLDTIAEKCDACRVAAGLHYLSDGQFSRYLVNMFY